MSYKSMQIISKRVDHAAEQKAITPTEGLILLQHLRLSGRGKYRYVADADRAIYADIAKRVRVANDGGYDNA